MSVFITGGTGYLGSYVVDHLLRAHPDERLMLLVRAKDLDQARAKLWRGLQLHMPADRFWQALERIDFVPGDLHQADLGISADDQRAILAGADSILHIAASLNRKSAKACLNTNLRGTLSVIQLARRLADAGGLRRYSHVSTVAVAGLRSGEVVGEDEAIDWARSDYDPYGRTKKFCEHMARTLLPDVPITIFRPSIVMGDSRFPDTTQFDMVRAFCVLAQLPVVPLDPAVRLDIVNADWVGRAVAEIHMKPDPAHDCYHLSAGTSALTTGAIGATMAEAAGHRLRFAPRLVGPFGRAVDAMAGMRRKSTLTLVGSLLKVFLPYITFDTVFDNTRAKQALGAAPVPFTTYCADLYRYATRVGYRYPYLPLPAGPRDRSPGS